MARFHLFLISCITHQANLLQGYFSFMDNHHYFNHKNKQCNNVRTEPDIGQGILVHPDIQTHDRTSDALPAESADCKMRCNAAIPALVAFAHRVMTAPPAIR
jgi:hypothetical protein